VGLRKFHSTPNIAGLESRRNKKSDQTTQHSTEEFSSDDESSEILEHKKIGKLKSDDGKEVLEPPLGFRDSLDPPVAFR